jgi:hypothetical protein
MEICAPYHVPGDLLWQKGLEDEFKKKNGTFQLR